MRKEIQNSLLCLVMTALTLSSTGVQAATEQSLQEALAALPNSADENSESYRSLVFNQVPNHIENLELKHRFAEAKALADLKLSIGKRLFGERSATTLDALQDLIFLSVQQKDEPARKQYLKTYSDLVAQLESEKRSSIVEQANALRSTRLQRKAQAAAAVLGIEM